MKTSASLAGFLFVLPAFAAPVLSVGYDNAAEESFDAALSWADAAGEVTVERRIGETGAWKTRATLDAGTTAWTDASPVVGRTYYYRVTAGGETSAPVRFTKLRRLALDGLPVVFWGDFTSQSWCKPASNAFDGSTGADSYPDANTSNAQIGVDFGETGTHVGLVRLYPRTTNGCQGRLNGTTVYGLASGWSETDENAGTALSAALSGVSDSAWYVLAVDGSDAYRYFYLQGAYGANVNECAFYGWNAADVAAAETPAPTLTVSRSDFADSFAVLSWDADAVDGDVTVQRRKGASGDWTDLATSSSGSYRDETMAYGVVWQYRLVYGARTGEPVSFLRYHRISTADAVVFYQGTADWDQNATGSRAFDGSLGTFPDLNYAQPKVGVDFGAATNYICSVRLAPRDGYYSSRLNGLVVYGSDNDAETEKGTDETGTALTAAVADVPGNLGQGVWYEISVDAANPYRTFYAKGNDNGNVAEIEFYGWNEADLGGSSDVVESIDNLTASGGGDHGYTAKLTWTAVRQPVAVQRAVSATGPWMDVAEVAAKAGAYTDAAAPIGVTSFYRLVCGEVTSVVVSYRSLRKLSVADATLFSQGNPWAAGSDHTAVFDGNTSTFADLWGGDDNPNGNPKIGVDFGGTAVTVAVVKFYPRNDCLYRMVGVRLYGSAADAAAEKASSESGTALTEALAEVPSAQWYVREVAQPRAFRTYYARDCYEGGQIAEMEFYGWTADDLPKTPKGVQVLFY